MRQLLPIILALLTACVPYRNYNPLIPKPVTINATETRITQSKKTLKTNNTQKRFSTIKPILAWWRNLNDPLLNILIIKAFKNNKDINIALANLEEARAYRKQSQRGLFPDINATGSYTRTRYHAQNSGAGSSLSKSYDAGLDTSWEIDLFGRIRALTRAAQAREDMARANLRNMYVLIAAEVASSYVTLRGLQHRRNIAVRNLKNQQRTHQASNDLNEAGMNSELDTVLTEAQLEMTRATIPTLDNAIQASINRLSVLTGELSIRLVNDLEQTRPLPTVPPIINIGSVRELVQRRPDIHYAAHQFRASIADYNVAVASQFPTVSLFGSLGFSATKLSDLGSGGLTSIVSPRLNWNVFSFGKIRQHIRQTDAVAKAAVANYEKTILEAFEDIQNAVNQYAYEDKRRLSLQKAATLSLKAAQMANTRYTSGIDPLTSLLDAEARQLATEDALAESETNVVLYLITIYKALGGGWEFVAPKQPVPPAHLKKAHKGL
jgi:outer membrane protein, multidrug efflux system